MEKHLVVGPLEVSLEISSGVVDFDIKIGSSRVALALSIWFYAEDQDMGISIMPMIHHCHEYGNTVYVDRGDHVTGVVGWISDYFIDVKVDEGVLAFRCRHDDLPLRVSGPATI